MGLLDLLLPRRCVACGAEGWDLCAPCAASLTRLRAPLCARCGAPTAWPVARCRECAGRRLAFASARAAFAYEGPAVPLVRAWKHGGRRALAPLAAGLVAAAVARPDAAVLTYVPAARSRELWRGDDPPRRLAEELAAIWGLPCAALVARRGERRPQKGLAPAARRRNVAGAFVSATGPPAAVVLVDDVYTTGATASAAASALRRGGTRRVEVVAFARALRARAVRGSAVG